MQLLSSLCLEQVEFNGLNSLHRFRRHFYTILKKVGFQFDNSCCPYRLHLFTIRTELLFVSVFFKRNLNDQN